MFFSFHCLFYSSNISPSIHILSSSNSGLANGFRRRGKSSSSSTSVKEKKSPSPSEHSQHTDIVVDSEHSQHTDVALDLEHSDGDQNSSSDRGTDPLHISSDQSDADVDNNKIDLHIEESDEDNIELHIDSDHSEHSEPSERTNLIVALEHTTQTDRIIDDSLILQPSTEEREDNNNITIYHQWWYVTTIYSWFVFSLHNPLFPHLYIETLSIKHHFQVFDWITGVMNKMNNTILYDNIMISILGYWVFYVCIFSFVLTVLTHETSVCTYTVVQQTSIVT